MALHHFQLWRGVLTACCLLLPTVFCTADLKPKFMVTFPAVIESGSEAKLCASLLQPNETMVMTVYLRKEEQNRTLLQETVKEEFHRCFTFRAPEVLSPQVQSIRVEVKGETFQMVEDRKVMFKYYRPLSFIQTDKPIYIPGQTVHFRIVTMDTKFAPLIQEYTTVAIEDNKRNRIGQWVNVTSGGLILQLSHQLNPEAQEGQYSIKASIGWRETFHRFTVKQYVLPKFEVKVNAPETVCIGEEELKIEACGRYTYGQPVPGKVRIQICRNLRQRIFHLEPRTVPCFNETLELNKTGCASAVVKMSVFMNETLKNELRDSLDYDVKLIEEGTETSATKMDKVLFSYVLGSAKFVDVPKFFDRGSVIEGKIQATHFNGTPIPHKKVYLFEGDRWNAVLLRNVTTDMNGMAHFSFNTSGRTEDSFDLIASIQENLHVEWRTPYYERKEINIILRQPTTGDTPAAPTYSDLTVTSLEGELACGSEAVITIKYTIIGESIGNEPADLIFLALSKGVLIRYEGMKITKKESNGVTEGKESFKLRVQSEMAPVVQILAYAVLPSGNVLAGSKNFQIEKCFTNKVRLEFSPSRAVPGEENTLKLSAEPGSLCGLSAVDQSVLILEPGERIDADKIFNLLPVKASSDYPRNVEDVLECVHVRPKRHGSYSDPVHDTFKSLGLKIATNLAIRRPPCLIFEGTEYHRHREYILYESAPIAVAQSMGMAYDGDMSAVVEAVVETVRTFFPETWIWRLVDLGQSGISELPVTVPDTITTWETEAFCLSSNGFGLAAPAQLTVFQPFFLELSLPYSIIRGELFELKATVFNYLSKCIMVKVTPAPSSDYTLKPSSNGKYSSCLCGNGRKTFQWTLIPSVLGVLNITVSAEAEQSQTVCDNEIVSVPDRGRIDTVTRSLLIRAEGTEKSKSFNWLLCPKGEALTEEIELSLPEDVVKGSARASVSVLGDILGRALQNLDGLLRMPYGCGEQNMALLSPNIYILQYLENTKQLTPAIRERATGFLKSGYQRQLNYKHYDGSYSTFGWGVSNTWLTAFVLRSFGKAKSYIFIDPEVIDGAKNWLIKQQQPNGCFERKGSLFNNRMKGGVSDEVTITAYITAAMLELGTPVSDSVVNASLSCLRNSMVNLANIYTTALLAYTFSLAGEAEIRAHLLEEFHDKASTKGGLFYGSQSESVSDSLSVEMSSYMLLAVLTKSSLSSADLGYASRIVSWLVKQQNPYGGFSSTQDTVVALQALALYATKVFSEDGSGTVTVLSGGGKKLAFDMNQNNKLLYQESSLQDAPGKYIIEAKGSICASVQMTLFYNIPTPNDSSTFSIQAKTKGSCRHPTLTITVLYDGAQNQTNMVVVDVKMLSGFTPAKSATAYLKTQRLVERVEAKNDHLIMYLKGVPKADPIEYSFKLDHVLPVINLKPAVLKIYDYYQTREQSETEYSYHCA